MWEKQGPIYISIYGFYIEIDYVLIKVCSPRGALCEIMWHETIKNIGSDWFQFISIYFIYSGCLGVEKKWNGAISSHSCARYGIWTCSASG